MMFPKPNPLNRANSWLGSFNQAVTGVIRPLIVASLVVTGGILGLRYLGLLESAELAAYDHLIQRQPRAGEDDRLLVVGITEDDLEALQEWPVSDRTLAQALIQLEQSQPRAIATDIFRNIPTEPGTQELLAQLQQPNRFVICKVSALAEVGIPPPPGVAPEQVGFADFVVDPGGILRRNLLMAGPPAPQTPFPIAHLCNQPGQTLLSISFRATLAYLEAEGVKADLTADQQLRFGSTVIPPIESTMGGYQRADTRGYQIMMAYRSETQGLTVVSLMAVLRGQVDPALIRDRIVFIGYTTPRAKDDFYTPYSVGRKDNRKMPGVIIHAQAASQLLSTVLDGRPLIWVWSGAVEGLWILAWSLGGGLLGWYLRHPATFALMILVGLGSLYGLCFLVFIQGGWIPLVPSVFTFMGTAMGVVLLERFSSSSYGQNVYRKVKIFFRVTVEIDEEKLEKQISEITETEYFQDLKGKAKRLRKRSFLPPEKSSLTAIWKNQTMSPWEHDRDGVGELSHHLDGALHLKESTKNAIPPRPDDSTQGNPQSSEEDSPDLPVKE